MKGRTDKRCRTGRFLVKYWAGKKLAGVGIDDMTLPNRRVWLFCPVEILKYERVWWMVSHLLSSLRCCQIKRWEKEIALTVVAIVDERLAVKNESVVAAAVTVLECVRHRTSGTRRNVSIVPGIAKSLFIHLLVWLCTQKFQTTRQEWNRSTEDVRCRRGLTPRPNYSYFWFMSHRKLHWSWKISTDSSIYSGSNWGFAFLRRGRRRGDQSQE